MSPLRLDVSFEYDVPGIPKLGFTRSVPVVVDRVTPCPRRTAPVVIDGKLDEWAELPLAPGAREFVDDRDHVWTGPADASFRFAVAHDEQFAYIAVRATDDRAIPVKDREPFKEDCVEVWLDARPDAVRSHGRGEINRFFQDFLYIATAPAEGPETYVYRKHKLPEGTRIACARAADDDGAGSYTVEIAVPGSYLDQMQGQPWSGFRLNVAMSDRDEPGGPDAQVWWRPAWNDENDTYAGSGTFARVPQAP
jgi:hypothetical protein